MIDKKEKNELDLSSEKLSLVYIPPRLNILLFDDIEWGAINTPESNLGVLAS
jgi:hypothetical protein